jgi:hypothetical protein
MIVTVWYAKKMKIRYGHSMGFSFNCDSNSIVYTSFFLFVQFNILLKRAHKKRDPKT